MSRLEDSPLLRQTDSPRSVGSKSVTIAEPESISPMLRPAPGGQDKSVPQSLKQYSAGVAKRMTGRPNINASTSSLNSQSSYKSDFTSEPEASEPKEHGHHSHGHREASSRLVSQVLDWLHEEKSKRSRKAKSKAKHSEPLSAVGNVHGNDSRESFHSAARRSSGTSDGDLALEKLEQILADNIKVTQGSDQTPTKEHKGINFPRRGSIIRKLRKGSTAGSSDTDYQDGDAIVPHTDVVLENSKTMSYSGGAGASDVDLSSSTKRAAKEKEDWRIFKSEIVGIAHTLRLKGWRRVPLDRGGDIDVERLSGALTNAVYVVSPPKDLPPPTPNVASSSVSLGPRKPPPKLLLRIYGPQVEHLIDRKNELSILRRLARKRIGPRLLGTFINGRFEEFFHARTLTAPDLRVPETSKNIAKRMRELHDGIELLEEERIGGSFVWKNWDKWVDRCEEVIQLVDQRIQSNEEKSKRPRSEVYKRRDLVCGVEWSVFRKTVDQYRRWLNEQYGGGEGVKSQLVFAHNDTQYGNLLRLEPSGESPLLIPANEHKQLVVIDFEYASANVPGLEFANHFTEWCYNYHDPDKSWACNTSIYPTPSEQYRFIKAYVQHRPQYHPHASATPGTAPSPGPSSVSSFMLDSRAPPSSYAEEERKREEQVEKEVQRLTHETRLWRVVNSAQWVAWGVVQAKLDSVEDGKMNSESTTPTKQDEDNTPGPRPAVLAGLDPLSAEMQLAADSAHDKRPEGLTAEALSQGQVLDQEEDQEEEFDYLAYAQDRALFFWGDVLRLGVLGVEVPEEVRRRVKNVYY